MGKGRAIANENQVRSVILSPLSPPNRETETTALSQKHTVIDKLTRTFNYRK